MSSVIEKRALRSLSSSYQKRIGGQSPTNPLLVWRRFQNIICEGSRVQFYKQGPRPPILLQRSYDEDLNAFFPWHSSYMIWTQRKEAHHLCHFRTVLIVFVEELYRFLKSLHALNEIFQSCTGSKTTNGLDFVTTLLKIWISQFGILNRTLVFIKPNIQHSIKGVEIRPSVSKSIVCIAPWFKVALPFSNCWFDIFSHMIVFNNMIKCCQCFFNILQVNQGMNTL